MPAIATLTLNPALDVTTDTDHVRPTHKLRCTPPGFEPGGGGINVARVVHALGGDVTAVFPCGGPAGAMIAELLAAAGVPAEVIAIPGATRESFTVNDLQSGEQFRFVLPGPPLDADAQAAVLARLRALPGPIAYIVASGSLPPGCDGTILATLAAQCRADGVRLVIDTSGPALAGCEGARAYLLKPSLREVEDLLGRTLDSEDAEVAAAREMRARGFAEVIVVSLAERGALMVADGVALRVPAVPVPPGSAVGAGDAMTAAITLALARGQHLEDALLFGVAAGAAALMTPGTELARRADVERLYAEARTRSGIGAAQNRP
ncbi:1-phosphofructokinase family hexose kinase [Sphingomonas sp. CJ20]